MTDNIVNFALQFLKSNLNPVVGVESYPPQANVHTRELTNSNFTAEGEEQTTNAPEDAGEGAAREGAGEEEEEEEEEGGDDSKKKKKKKKKKKTAAAVEEEDKPKAKKPARGAIKQMQEALEQMRLEEEKKKREEEERIKAEEEAEERRLEKVCNFFWIFYLASLSIAYYGSSKVLHAQLHIPIEFFN